MVRHHSAFPGALAVAFGGLLLAAAMRTGVAPLAGPVPPTVAVVLMVSERSNPSELIRLLREVGSYDTMAGARYVAQAFAALHRGEAPVVQIPMPSSAVAEAVTQAAPRAGATALVLVIDPGR
jgi:hypothetical protein